MWHPLSLLSVFILIIASGEAVYGPAQVIDPPNQDGVTVGGQFGMGLAISGDGNTLVAGAPRQSPFGVNSRGNAFVYRRRSGEQFGFAQDVTGPQSVSGAYGAEIAMYSNASYLFVAATTMGGGFGGRIVVWREDGGQYTYVATIGATLAQFGDRLGTSISLSTDGNTMAIGAPQRSNSPGVVQVCTRGADNWASLGPTCLSPPLSVPGGGTTNVGFGGSVSLSAAGDVLAVGARGAAYVFAKSSSHGRVGRGSPRLRLPHAELLLALAADGPAELRDVSGDVPRRRLRGRGRTRGGRRQQRDGLGV